MVATKKPTIGWTNRDLEEMANGILKDNLVTAAPVPITSIARNYAFDLLATHMPAKLSIFLGILDWQSRTIFLDEQEAPEVQNATAARLFSRAWLEERPQNLKITDGVMGLARRPIAVHGEEMELHADVLAAYLLMPLQLLSQFKLATPDSLARIFVVPEEMVRWRLTLG